jgi:general secretion pathway protein D
MKFNVARILFAASLLLPSLHLLEAQDAALTPSQAAHQEAVKREKVIIEANRAISDGQRFLASGNFDQAAGRFQFALDNLTPGGVSANAYQRAEVGMAQAKEGQAKALADDHKFAQANTLLQQAIVLDPNNPVYPADIDQLKQDQMAYEAQVRDPEGTTVNPAVTDDFKAQVATVQKLQFQGDAYFRTGQYEKAEETYSKILIIDPYNKAARDKMAHVELYRNRADQFRHEEYEGKQYEKLDHQWAEDISPDIVETATLNTPIETESNRVRIQRKLNSIIIDKVNFEKLDIAAVIQFLQEKSKELDPDHEGINFVLRLNTEAAPASAPGAPDAAPPAHPIRREVSITLSDVPLADVLQYIVNQTNLQFSVEDYAVYLRPSIDEGETLSVRTYLVPPNFFEGSSLHVTLGEASSDTPTNITSVSVDAKQALIDKGIHFPAEATAVFLPGSSKLVVRDTPEQLDLIANIIDEESKQGPQQVSIESKLAEFNQDAIKELNFNYLIGSIHNPAGTQNKIGFETQLRSADPSSGTTASTIFPAGFSQPPGGLTPDGISDLIQENPASPSGVSPSGVLNSALGVTNNTSNLLQVGVVLDGQGVAALVQAINNIQGVSLLSAPNVTTQSGLKANIDIVQEFPYPTSFEKPKLSNSSNLAYSSGANANEALVLAIPPTPREFVTQDVGVSLEVKPTTYPDQRIDLDITKAQVLDFDGFIDYGVPIVTSLQEGSTTILTLGTINQPVFNLRSMVTDLQVMDGQTAVLGGLMNEDTQEVNDKVPVLGDIPLVGRLFQSKVTERNKKCLIFFITARLIKADGKPQYVKTLDAEPEEEALPQPDQQIGPAGNLPPLPEETPNS